MLVLCVQLQQVPVLKGPFAALLAMLLRVVVDVGGVQLEPLLAREGRLALLAGEPPCVLGQVARAMGFQAGQGGEDAPAVRA